MKDSASKYLSFWLDGVKRKKMNCLEYQSLISLQIDGDMSPAQVVEAERHVAACSRCAALYADLRIVVSEASQLPLFEPDDRVWGRLHDDDVKLLIAHMH